jgi:hypothetical protein
MSYLRATSAFLTAIAAFAGNGVQLVNPGNENTGLRLVLPSAPADRQPAIVPGSSATIAGLINAGAQTITAPAGYGFCWLQVPGTWLKALFAGTGVQPPSDNLQLNSECALDARGLWATALVSSGLLAAFASPTVLPLPVLAS